VWGLALLTGVLVGAASAPAAQRPAPVRASALRAEFDEQHFLTRYVFEVTPSVSVRRIHFDWRLQPPQEDPKCDLLAVQSPTRTGSTYAGHASWLHGDQHGCNHQVMDADRHPGYVLVVATIVTRTRGTWECATTIRGTVTATSPYVPTCRKRPV
jgi:hypothetical protein